MRIKAFAALALLATSAGCYHATVDTGRAPSGVVVENQWAHSFIYGLVPPSTVNVAQQCPQGIARVETQQSFLNGLVSALTGGIYTPMTITVSCAGGTASAAEVIRVPAGADAARAMNQAVELAKDSGEAVYVKFGS